ncbi:MAG: hypothetical protein HY364_05565 [Candidatus Aenigmarchaeota archaeon]|nr:hypothetical protein [Candidatus Aenigmarchaeota archaeon]
MKGNIFLLVAALVFSGISFAQQYSYYDITIYRDDIANSTVSVKPGRVSYFPMTLGSYSGELISFEDRPLYKIYFSFREEIAIEGLEPLVFETNNITLKIPYFPDAKQLNIYDENNLTAGAISLTLFSNTCGDNACQPHESYESCSKDCRSGSADDYCDAVADGICDIDCAPAADADCSALVPPEAKQTNPDAIILATAAFIVILGGVIIYVFRKLGGQD